MVKNNQNIPTKNIKAPTSIKSKEIFDSFMKSRKNDPKNTNVENNMPRYPANDSLQEEVAANITIAAKDISNMYGRRTS